MPRKTDGTALIRTAPPAAASWALAVPREVVPVKGIEHLYVVLRICPIGG